MWDPQVHDGVGIASATLAQVCGVLAGARGTVQDRPRSIPATQRG
jgi:hypothetical protein